MYELFTERFLSNSSITRPPGFDLIQRIYQRDIEKIVEYFHSRVYAVKSNHLLCRLLGVGSVSTSYSLDRYLEVAIARSPYVAKHFNFTSAINYGEVRQGANTVFYGPSCSEIILYSEDYFDVSEVARDWKNAQAIKVLEHPISDLGLILPNGYKNSTDYGLVVISINIPMLLVQYRGFLLEQMRKISDGSASLLGDTHFVHMYVIPNMLYSHAELVVANRLMNLFYGAPQGSATKKYPFPIVNYGDKMDKELSAVLKHITDTRMPYASFLKNIPSIFAEDAQMALLMPDIARTRQVWWAMLISRLKMMKFLLDAGSSSGMNGALINKLKLDFKRIRDEHVLSTVLPHDLLESTEETIDEILAL